MLPRRGLVRSVTAAVHRAPLTGQLVSTRGYATSRITSGNVLLTGASRASPLTRLRTSAAAGPILLGQIPSSSRAISLWGSKKPEAPAPETSASAATPAQPEAAAPPPQSAPDVAAAADTANAGQSSGWSLWGWGSKPAAPAPAPISEQTAAAEPATTSAVADPAATSAVNPDTVSSDLSQIISSDLDAYGSVSAIPETIGYLRTLGIEFGYGTTSMIQWVFEHIHVYTGLPWWGSILATTLFFRAALWRPVLLGQEHSTRLNLLRVKEPMYERMTEALKTATMAKDLVGVQAAKLAMKNIESQYNVKKFMPFISFVQIPIGFGMFRILRAMSDLPVPSLESGGVLWFTDLSVSDPWYILPFMGTLSMLATMRVTSRYSTPQQQQVQKTMTMVLMPVGLLFTSFMPAGLQFYFVATGATSLAQTALTFNPTFRRLAGMSPLPTPQELAAKAPPTAPSKGILDDLKKSLNNAKEMAGGKMDESANKKETQRKEEEEARMQAEYYESLRERMAELEKKMKRRP